MEVTEKGLVIAAVCQALREGAADAAASFLKRDYPFAPDPVFWSPIVPRGRLLKALIEIDGLELVVNEDYAARVDQLRDLAGKSMADTGNPFFRALQLLERLRR